MSDIADPLSQITVRTDTDQLFATQAMPQRTLQDLETHLQRLSVSLGEPCHQLLAEERFDQLVAVLEAQGPALLDVREQQYVLQQVEHRRAAVFDDVRRAFEHRLELGDLGPAEGLLDRARRIDAGAVGGMEVAFQQARRLARRSGERARALEDARRLAADGRLEQMRDARAIFESLLEGPDDDEVDRGQIERELSRLDDRMDFEMAGQAATHTKMLLGHLPPKLEALDELYTLRERGDQRFYAQGDRAEPLPAVIDRLECELRPMLTARVESDLAGVERLVESERLAPALRRLLRYRGYWSLIGDDLRERALARQQDLEAALARQALVDAAVERAFELMEGGETARAVELIELSRTRIGGEVTRLDELLETVHRHRLQPLTNRVDDLVQQAGRLGGLWSKQLDTLLAQAEEVGLAFGEVVRADDAVFADLRGRHRALLAYLRGLAEARRLHDAGRFEPARCQLESLATMLPAHADAIRVLLEGLGVDRSIEELMARIRGLYGHEPDQALALALENAALDGRVRDFADFATVERALYRADRLERAGRYREALDTLQSTRGRLSNRDHRDLMAAIERMMSVIRDAGRVARLLEQQAESDDPAEHELIANRLHDLSVGLDRAEQVDLMLSAQIPRRLQSLREAMASWRQSGALDFEAVEADARFLRARAHPPGPELTHLLQEYDFAVRLLEARQTLFAGAFDEAEGLIEPFLGGPFGGRAKAFIVRCRAQRALARAHAAVAELDMDGARAALQSAPPADVQVQAARLFVERFAAAIEPLVDPESGAEPAASDGSGRDAIEAFRVARVLIEQQPASPAFEQALVRLGRARTGFTQRRIAAADPRLPGVQVEVMTWLARDYDAAGAIEPEFEALIHEAQHRAPADLRALFAWVEAREAAIDRAGADEVGLALGRLRAALALSVELPGFPTRAEIEAAAGRAEALRDAVARRSSDRERVLGLLQQSRVRAHRGPLEQAAEIEAAHPGRPFGAAARLAAWDAAEALVSTARSHLSADRVADAIEAIRELVRLCEAHPLPHAERLDVTGPGGRMLGPGAEPVLSHLTADLEKRRVQRAALADELADFEQRTAEFEAQRDLALELAVREREPGLVEEQARRLGAEVETVALAVRARRVEAARLGDEPRVRALLIRLDAMNVDALEQEVGRRRREASDAVRTLNDYRRKGERVIERHFDEIERLSAQFQASARVQRYVNHFRVLLRRPPA